LKKAGQNVAHGLDGCSIQVKGMRISVQVNLTNFDVLNRCFECLCEQYPEAVGQAMMNFAQDILATANTIVPVRTAT
jgi:hypothetical protein